MTKQVVIFFLMVGMHNLANAALPRLNGAPLPPLCKVDIGKDTVLASGSSITLDAGTKFLKYIWSTGDSTRSITINSPGIYSVTTTDSSGCIDGDVIQVFDDSCSIQKINIDAGWNMISSYVIPLNPDILEVITSIKDDILLIKNGAGQITIPAFDLNNIGNWNVLEGYKLKTVTSTVLSMACTQVDPSTTPITLPAGWSIISYLRDSNMDVGLALNSITSDILIIKDARGNAYIPTFGINNMGDMLPGQGYRIKLRNGSVLTYPAN